MFNVVLRNGKRFDADPSNSILDAAQSAGLTLEHSCRTGRCGVCKAFVAGETACLRGEEGLSAAERDAGMILTCCRAPSSDLTVDLDDLGRLSGIVVKTLPCRIASIDHPSPTIARVTLRLPPNANFDFLAGQYIDVVVGADKRSYSIANTKRPSGELDLLIRKVDGGRLSEYWFGAAKAEDLLRFQGPRGTFFLRDGECSRIVFLATGTGIAPVRALMQELVSSGVLEQKQVFIYWGNRSADDFALALDGEFAGATLIPLVSRPDDSWIGRRGYVQNALVHDFDKFDEMFVYACGSEDMIQDAEHLLADAGLPRGRFLSDAFVSSD